MNRIFILILSGICFYSVHGQTEILPKPTGQYFIGVTYMSFVDDSRKEIFDNHQESHREMTLKVWEKQGYLRF